MFRVSNPYRAEGLQLICKTSSNGCRGAPNVDRQRSMPMMTLQIQSAVTILAQAILVQGSSLSKVQVFLLRSLLGAWAALAGHHAVVEGADGFVSG